MKFIFFLIADFFVITALIIASSLNIVPLKITGPLVFACIVGIWGYWFFGIASSFKKQSIKSGEELKNIQIGAIATPNAYIGGAVVATLIAAYGFYYFAGIGKIVCIILLVAYFIALAYYWKNKNKTIERMKTSSPTQYKLKNQAVVFGLSAWFIATLIFSAFLPKVTNVVISLLLGVIIGIIYFYSKNKSEKSN